jgi:hypothetical protein
MRYYVPNFGFNGGQLRAQISSTFINFLQNSGGNPAHINMLWGTALNISAISTPVQNITFSHAAKQSVTS